MPLPQTHYGPRIDDLSGAIGENSTPPLIIKLRSRSPLHVEVTSFAADQRFPLGLCLNHASALSEARLHSKARQR